MATANQIVRELKNRKEAVKDFLVDVLVESGIKDVKVIDKVVTERKVISSIEEEKLKDQISILETELEKLKTKSDDQKNSEKEAKLKEQVADLKIRIKELEVEIKKSNEAWKKKNKEEYKVEWKTVFKDVDHIVVTKFRDDENQPTLFLNAHGKFISVDDKKAFTAANKGGVLKLTFKQVKKMLTKMKDTKGIMINPAFNVKTIISN